MKEKAGHKDHAYNCMKVRYSALLKYKDQMTIKIKN